MYVGYDSVTLGTIPANPQVVLAYDDGEFSNYTVAKRLFPHAHVFSIAVNASNTADFLDVEAGAATPGEVEGWWKRCKAAGIWRPGLYASLDNMPDIKTIMDHTAAARDDYRLWVAHYTDVPHNEGGYDGTQWTKNALGRNLDESLLLPTFVQGKVAKPSPKKYADLVFDPTTETWDIRGIPGSLSQLK